MSHELHGVLCLTRLCGKDRNKGCTTPLISKCISYFNCTKDILLPINSAHHALPQCALTTGAPYLHTQAKAGIGTKVFKGEDRFLVSCWQREAGIAQSSLYTAVMKWRGVFAALGISVFGVL